MEYDGAAWQALARLLYVRRMYQPFRPKAYIIGRYSAEQLARLAGTGSTLLKWTDTAGATFETVIDSFAMPMKRDL